MLECFLWQREKKDIAFSFSLTQEALSQVEGLILDSGLSEQEFWFTVVNSGLRTIAAGNDSQDGLSEMPIDENLRGRILQLQLDKEVSLDEMMMDILRAGVTALEVNAIIPQQVLLEPHKYTDHMWSPNHFAIEQESALLREN